MLPDPPLVAIVGPTGVGKSALALQLAPEFHGEVINADSRLLYRGMDIGTAKPTPRERALVPHHLVDLLDPDQPFNLARYLDLARHAITDTHARDKQPFLVGGTGLYVWGLLEGLKAPQVPPNPALRASLEERAHREGSQALYRDLQARDPLAAARMDPRNVRRMVRALEVCIETGIPFSQLQRRDPPPYDAFILGLTLERQELYRRLDRRVDAMLEAGWLQEVRELRRRGHGPGLPSVSALGYRELFAALDGEMSLEEAVRRIKTATRRFARRQYAWFRPSDPRIAWLTADAQAPERARDLVARFLTARKTACYNGSTTGEREREFR